MRSRVLGAFVIGEDDQVKMWPPSEELRAFLDVSGEFERPVYIGWGSMIAVGPLHMLKLALRSLMLVGKRGVILSGWAKIHASLLDDCDAPDVDAMRSFLAANVFIIESHAPHEWLFPRCAAIVHHGGAGTTASALRSGNPSVVTPCFADQPELASKVETLGVGVALCQFHHVDVKDLAKGLNKVLRDEPLRDRAHALGQKLREEDGALVAAADISSRINRSIGD